jgi:orotate phosphoribosyltransferase
MRPESAKLWHERSIEPLQYLRLNSDCTEGVEMNYRSVADLDDQIVNWLGRLPSGLEVIVGVPRSGMLVANLLSLHLNLPMTDVEGLLQGRMIQTGGRIKRDDLQSLLAQKRRVLVVDDSVLSGDQMNAVKARVKAANLPHDILYASPYVVSGKEKCVDFFIEVLPAPRCFEWNLMHHKLFLDNACMDIDGVLCCDPGEDENDDGPMYQRFICEAAPLYLPSHPVANLVTCRLEKYRTQTQEWLARNGVAYNNLFMMDYPNMAERRAAASYAQFKAEIYLRTKSWLFIESSLQQAREISKLTGKHVFCMDTREMVAPGTAAARRRKILEAPTTVSQALKTSINDAIRVSKAVGRRLRRLAYPKQKAGVL